MQTSEKRLSKLVSAFQRSKESGWKSYSIQRIISSQLLALTEELGVYKYLTYSGDIEESKDALLVSSIFFMVPPIMFVPIKDLLARSVPLEISC